MSQKLAKFTLIEHGPNNREWTTKTAKVTGSNTAPWKVKVSKQLTPDWMAAKDEAVGSDKDGDIIVTGAVNGVKTRGAYYIIVVQAYP